MRKTSQDGGDSTSITSGIENESRKSGAGILRSTKNSIKRKVQNFSNENDDTANEPLLHKTKEKAEIEKQSAKFLLSKTKTDFSSEKGEDKDKLLADDKVTQPSNSDVTGITRSVPIGNGLKEQKVFNSQSLSTACIHNHMNTNVFNSMEGTRTLTTAKTQILLELDTSKASSYSPSPLIFTTAKIHTDGKIQQMEPVQVTPVPILSTIEGGVIKTETKLKDLESKSREALKKYDINDISNKVNTLHQSKECKDIVSTSTTTPNLIQNVSKNHSANVTLKQNSVINVSTEPTKTVNDSLSKGNKARVDGAYQLNESNVSNIKSTTAQIPTTSPITNKTPKTESFSIKDLQISLENKNKACSHKLEGKVGKEKDLTVNVACSSKIDLSEKGSQGIPIIDKDYVDMNKNVQSIPSSEKLSITENKKVELQSGIIKPLSKSSDTELGSSSKEYSSKSNYTSVTNTSTEGKMTVNTVVKDQISNVKSPNKLAENKTEKQIKETKPGNKSDTQGQSIEKKSIENNVTKPSLTETLLASTEKPLSPTSKSKEIHPHTKPVSSVCIHTVSAANVPHSALSNINITSTSINTISNIKTKAIVDHFKPIPDLNTNITKLSTDASVPFCEGVTSSKVASFNSATSVMTGIKKSESKHSENLDLKTPTTVSKNTATIVSSISKPTTNSSSTKLEKPIISSQTGTGKSTSGGASPACLSTVKNTSSYIPTVAPTAKSSISNAVLDKVSVNLTSSTNNKSVSSISNNTKSEIKISKLSTVTDNNSMKSSTPKPKITQSESKPGDNPKGGKVSRA